MDADYALEVWHRRKWVAVIVFLTAVVGVVSGTLALPDMYRTSATVLVARQQVSEAYVKTSVTTELETRIQTIHQQVMSRAALHDLIVALDLHPELGGSIPDGVIARMRSDVELELESVAQAFGRSTIAFTLTYSGRDPQTVARVTNTLAEQYVEENMKSRTGQAARTAEFLRTQLADVKRQLGENEQRASEFKLRHDGELPDQMLVTLAALERVYTKLRMNNEYQNRALERRERLEQQQAQADAVGGTAVVSGTPPKIELPTLRLELTELRRQFTDEHPDVIRVKAQITALERQTPTAGTNGSTAAAGTRDAVTRLAKLFQDVDAQLGPLREEEAFLRKTIADYEARMANAPRLQQEFQQLSSDYESTKERYATLLRRYEEAQLSDDLEQGNSVEQFRILDAALPPTAPAAPNRPQLLIMGLVASLALAFGAVVGAERIDTTFHRVEDLRAFVNVPMLGAIHRIPTADARRRQRRLHSVIAVLFAMLLAMVAAGVQYVATDNEQLLRIVARLG
jgi:polysaccharide biosynthesis transport protein